MPADAIQINQAWQLHEWPDGAVAWNALTARTHALDPFSAAVLRASRLTLCPTPQMAQHLAEKLQLPLDEALQAAILKALASLQQLEVL